MTDHPVPAVLPAETSDNFFLRLAFQLKSSVSPPIQSLFRVFSIVTFRDNSTPKEQIRYVTGTNCESCFLANSICAERSALVQLRHVKGISVEKVYIVCDSQDYITPGLLCREFMLDNFCNEHTMIVTCGENKVPRTFSLKDLFPFPNVYLNIDRDQLNSFARQLSKQVQSPLDYFSKINQPTWSNLFQQILSLSQTHVDDDGPRHPVAYSAGVLFNNNKIVTVVHHKGIEYGCSVDAITRLGPFLETERKIGNEPVVMLQCDQFGILHAPSSVARAYLYEKNYGKTKIVVHEKGGELKQVLAAVLSPHGPKVDELFKKPKL